MKYITPTYNKEVIESEDIMNVSANVVQTETKTETSMSFEDLANMLYPQE